MIISRKSDAVSNMLTDKADLDDIGIDYLGDDSHWHVHAAGGPDHVLLVIAKRSDGHMQFGIFSSIASARQWAREIDTWAGEDGMIVTAPYIIDLPEFGNIETREQN